MEKRRINRTTEKRGNKYKWCWNYIKYRLWRGRTALLFDPLPPPWSPVPLSCSLHLQLKKQIILKTLKTSAKTKQNNPQNNNKKQNSKPKVSGYFNNTFKLVETRSSHRSFRHIPSSVSSEVLAFLFRAEDVNSCNNKSRHLSKCVWCICLANLVYECTHLNFHSRRLSRYYKHRNIVENIWLRILTLKTKAEF